MRKKGDVSYTKSGRKTTVVTERAEATPEESAEIDRLEAIEEQEFGVRINFRWDRKHLEQLKEVAELMGVPYQAYMKMVLSKQMVTDIQMLKGELSFPIPASTSTAWAPPNIAALIHNNPAPFINGTTDTKDLFGKTDAEILDDDKTRKSKSNPFLGDRGPIVT